MAKKNPATAVYYRVSTHGQTHASQKKAVGDWLKQNGVDDYREYVDVETGRHTRRAAFEKLQGEIQAGRVSTVVCFRLDRLSRSLKDGVNLIADWLDRGVRLVAVTQQIDLTGATGRLVGALIFGLAEIEIEGRRERTRAGLEAARKNGVELGGSSGGWLAGKIRDKAPAIRKLLESGTSIAMTARTTGVSRQTVRKIAAMNGAAVPRRRSPRKGK